VQVATDYKTAPYPVDSGVVEQEAAQLAVVRPRLVAQSVERREDRSSADPFVAAVPQLCMSRQV